MASITVKWLPSAGSTVMEELDSATGALVQSTTLAGCVLSNAMYQSYGSMAADNSAAYWTCGATGVSARALSRLFQNGTVQHMPYSVPTTTYLPRGAAAAALAAWYTCDARGIR